ncbi:MAG: transcription-repair coupling factor [Tissierellia bacterium]|nr:transcription-repair coupling factor [Tissierellia bacterium]
MDFLTAILKEIKSYQDVIYRIKQEETPIATYGLGSQGIGHFIKGLWEDIQKPILFIAHDELKGRRIYEDLKNLSMEDVYFLPNKELFYYDREAVSQDRWRDRLKTITEIMRDKAKVVVTTQPALANYYMATSLVQDQIFSIVQGEEYDPHKIMEQLVQMGFESVHQVEGMGQFSWRGGILDVYTMSEFPYRIEFFDTEVDSIRSFSPDTQRSLEILSEVEILPVREYFITDTIREALIKNLEKDLQNSKKKTKNNKRQEEKFGKYIEYLKEHHFISNMDLLIPYFPKDALGSVLDFYQERPLILLDEPRRIEEGANQELTEHIEHYSEMLGFGEVLLGHKKMKFSLEETWDMIKGESLLIMNSIVKSLQGFQVKNISNFSMKSVVNFRGKMSLFKEELTHFVKQGYHIVILGGNEKKCERLVDMVTEMGMSCEYRKQRDEPWGSSPIIITPGGIREGFEYPHIKFVLINHGEIYGSFQERKKRPKKKKRKDLNFQDLKPGDYVVHENHGIGQYMGTEQLEVQGVKKDYINISYRGGDKLFLPIDQLSYIHKYIGGEGKAPKVNKLNSTEWNRTKQKAKKSVEDMAEDLIELYAKRENKKGFAFSPDSDWQREFEDAFPYKETEGQLQSAEEIKRDMEKPKPMDRLLCADVGYGKTEVALRAAFKAILDGKQVAFLVPTTILAQQHYNTMMERFADFPVEIAVFSRFRTAKEQKKDLERLRKGLVDIAIGTHRLLSKDVKFKDLGLLIVDEEQRFGVRHKETLKMMKETVDTLTLTATPIPRTLQMSLVGIRDMSVIDEPPEERFPVQTYVVEYNPLLIREAIIREVERSGQVYFVYNRVQSMESKLKELKELVPEVRFSIANGQMSETLLENTMFSFVNREVDVLLCSTIIETGMDVSNANTMIIYESNRLGLSQLYQLRGRIGRSNKLAYAYFTYERDTSISEVAEKRLKSIKEFTEFGSGYKIALRDLEIRGSGNILGASQSGHLGSIGYDLYIKYLKEAVMKLKGLKEDDVVETTMDIKVDAYIPKTYVEDEEQRLELYKKISVIEDEEDYRDVLDELIDRFGDISSSVSNLMDLSYIRVMAGKVNVESITERNNHFQLNFIKGYQLDLALVNELKHRYRQKVDVSLSDPGYIQLKESKYPLEDLKEIIKILTLHKKYTKKNEE